MKDIRFYEELRHKGRKEEESSGVVTAVYYKNHWVGRYANLLYGCISAVYDEPNSPVASSSVAASYLEDCCKRVSEARAREIHPRLFEYLEG